MKFFILGEGGWVINFFYGTYMQIGSEECLRSIFKSLFYSDKSSWESSLRNYFGLNYALRENETLCAIKKRVLFAQKSFETMKNQIIILKKNYIEPF